MSVHKFVFAQDDPFIGVHAECQECRKLFMYYEGDSVTKAIRDMELHVCKPYDLEAAVLARGGD